MANAKPIRANRREPTGATAVSASEALRQAYEDLLWALINSTEFQMKR